MGRERQDAEGPPTGRRLTVTEAAAELGISAEAVRSRLKRGTLQSAKEGSTVYVLLGTDRTRPGTDQTTLEPDRAGDQTAYVEALQEQIGYLRGVIATRDRELRERAEEVRRRDSALERQQELTAMFANRLRALEPPQERAEAKGGVEDRSGSEGPQTASSEAPRSSWRQRVRDLRRRFIG